MKASLLLLLLFITSCAFIADNFEEDILKENNITPKPKNTKTYCIKSPKESIISLHKPEQQNLKEALAKIKEKGIELDFVDKVAIWSLAQMTTRPDLSSPSARFQILLHHKNKEYYFNIYSHNKKSLPFMYALKFLLKEFKSSYSLAAIVDLFQDSYSKQLYISEELESFLTKNQRELLLNKKLKMRFTRGSETLRTGERFYRQVIPKSFTHNLHSKDYKVSDSLFNFNKTPNFSTKCNFDMKLYQESNFMISKNPVKANVFGLKSGNDMFLASTTQEITGLNTLGSTSFFSGTQNNRNPGFCTFRKKSSKKHFLWLSSTNSRDPGQHLFHLAEYGLQGISKSSELSELLQFSRHLFLKNPIRLIIESRKSEKKQMKELLKLNLPIYNSSKLGKIWGYLSTQKNSSFIIDEREEGSLSCN